MRDLLLTIAVVGTCIAVVGWSGRHDDLGSSQVRNVARTLTVGFVIVALLLLIAWVLDYGGASQSS